MDHAANLRTSPFGGVSEMARPVVSVTRIGTFSAAHRLHSVHLNDAENQEIFGKCNNPNGHGHNYTVEVRIRGPVDGRTGMVMNISDLKVALANVLDLLDHKHIDRDVPYFRDGNIVSTTENVTVFIWEMLMSELGVSNLLLSQVKVHETDKNVFVYEGQVFNGDRFDIV